MNRFPHTICVRLSDEDKQRYERLLKRFGKGWRSTKSESFRELLRRLGDELSFETQWDNQPFDSFEDPQPEAEEQEHAEGPDESPGPEHCIVE